jgi:TolA-binding protein
MEVFELQTRCEQLRGTIQALESQLQQQQQQRQPLSPIERGLGRREEGEGELFRHKFQGLGDVLAHNRETQDQLLKCQKENVRLRFEYEQAIVELPRLQVGVVGGASHVTYQEYISPLVDVWYDCKYQDFLFLFRHRLRISRSI